MSDLNRIKPAFRTKGAVTGNFGRAKVKSGSTLNDIGHTDCENVSIVRPEEYERRLQEALRETENPRLIAFIEGQLRDLRVQRGEGEVRLQTKPTAPPFRTPGC